MKERMDFTRDAILDILKNNQCVISSHEHLGIETLVFDNGFEHTYNQNIGGLFENLNNLDWIVIYRYLATVVTTMPHYSFSKDIMWKSNITSGYGVYGFSNKELLASCYEWYVNNPQQIPLPFISIDINASLNELRELIKRSIFPVMGFKVHPSARGVSIKELARSDFFRFASEMKLPILLHCARKGMAGDFEDIYLNLLNKAMEYDLTICIAHAGFLDDKIKAIEKIGKIYVGISPWSIITDSVYSNDELEFNVEKLENFINIFPDKILYGGDSPFDVQVWSTREKHGRGRNFDFMVLNKVIKKMGIYLARKIFYDNPVGYLASR